MATQPIQKQISTEAEAIICSTRKKVFKTELEAIKWEADNRAKYPSNPKQTAYKCEKCPDYHLTSMAPGQITMARPAVNLSLPHKPQGTTKLEIKRLFSEEKLSRQQIADKLGISYEIVCAHLRELGLGSGIRHRHTANVPKPVLDLDSIQQKKEQLQAELTRLQQEEERLRELKRLKVMWCWEGKGVLMQKEEYRFALAVEDAKELVTKLEDLLTQ